MRMRRMKSLPSYSMFSMLLLASTTIRNPHPQRENSPSRSGILTVEAAAWMGSSSSTFGSSSSKSCLASSQKKNGVGGVDFGGFLSIHSGTRTSISLPRTLSSSTSLVMYFDDISRQHNVQQWNIPLISGSSPPPRFSSSYTEAKQQALQDFLGYSNAESTRHLSNEQVERELRKWALDTGAVRPSQTNNKSENDDRKASLSARIKNQNDQDQDKNAKYSSISKVSVAPPIVPSASASASTVTSSIVHSLAFLWECIFETVQQHYQQQQEHKHQLEKDNTGKKKNDENRELHLVTFPHTVLLWDYDQMSTMMMACEFARDKVLENKQEGQHLELTLDLFHPNYKHSPKLWSPDRHSPFPTAGIRVVENKGRNQEKTSYRPHGSVPTLGELEALFLAPPAIRELSAIRKTDDDSDLGTKNRHTISRDILRACQLWMQHRNEIQPRMTSGKKQMLRSDLVLIDDPTPRQRKTDGNQPPQIVMTHQYYEYYLYKMVWRTLSTMVEQQQQCTHKRYPSSTSPLMITRMIVASNYHDTADNFQRVAITINAALKRVTNGTLQVTQVFHPNHSNPTRRAPFPVMELELSSPSSSKEH